MFVLVAATLPSAAAQERRQLELAADGSTPLATVVADLERRFGWVVTYEDPIYEHSSDVQDVSALSHKPHDPTSAPILSPRQGTFVVDIDLPPGKAEPAVPLASVRQVVRIYNESGNAGRFRVVGTEGMVHVLPYASNGADGGLVPRRSILETRIRIPAGRRPAATFLREVVTSVESKAGVDIRIMSAPAHLFATAMVEPDVTDDLALNILAREFRQIGDARLSWRLMYSPTDRNYMLTVYRVSRLQKVK